MLDEAMDSPLGQFRSEARAWLETYFPASLKGRTATTADETEGMEDIDDQVAWKKAMVDTGWGTPTWPVEYGGGGLSSAQAGVLNQEMARVGAYNPLIVGTGVTMIGPTILDYGTEEQKRTYVPPIARGEVRWCVGYSEPNAGSDLAALETKCEDAGDHWKVNGTKLWTSGAQYSDWCGALVRTSSSGKKQDGISFLLIDMHQPGIETRPIRLIDGTAAFCEAFFTDAIAPKDAILGEVNKGWGVGKRLLEHERAYQTSASPKRQTVPLHELAKRYVGVDAFGRIADPDLRSRLARHQMDARMHELALARVMAAAHANPGGASLVPVLKNSATKVSQVRAELMLEIMGMRGLGWEGDGFTVEELDAVRGWLMSKATSIYGGSSEIQNNIIAKRILGLPDGKGAP